MEEYDEVYTLHLQDDVRFVTKDVTPLEKAAVIVALDKLVEEESVLHSRDTARQTSIWDKRRKGMRDSEWLTRNFDHDFSD